MTSKHRTKKDSAQSDSCPIHIGAEIRRVLKARRLTGSWLAIHLECDRTNVYKICRRPTIDSGLLFRISQAIGYDFFALYSGCLTKEDGETARPVAANETPEDVK